MASNPKKKLYFTPSMDNTLLMEVVQHNPWKNGNTVYLNILEIFKQVDAFRGVERRALQDRVDRLLKAFRSEQLQSLRRSGTEEQYNEREGLLQEVSDLEREWGSQAPKKRPAPPTASQVRSQAAKMMGLAMSNVLSTPMRPNLTLCQPGRIFSDNDPLPAAIPPCRKNQTEALPAATAAAPPADGNTWEAPALVLEATAPVLEAPAPGPEASTPVPCLEEADQVEDCVPEAAEEGGSFMTIAERGEDQAKRKKRRALTPAARFSSTMEYLRSKQQIEADVRREHMEIKSEDQRLRKEELEIRRLEAENDKERLQTMKQQQEAREKLDEARRKEDQKHVQSLMEQQTKMMDALLQLVAKK